MSGQAETDARYYRLALVLAKRRDLSAAAEYARHALRINGQNELARTLLGLCLYELGEPGAAQDAAEYADAQDDLKRADLIRRNSWRKAARIMRSIPHQSVRVLNAQGCLFAAAGRYAKAERFFAKALEKDRGNSLASECLTETVKLRKLWSL